MILSRGAGVPNAATDMTISYVSLTHFYCPADFFSFN